MNILTLDIGKFNTVYRDYMCESGKTGRADNLLKLSALNCFPPFSHFVIDRSFPMKLRNG